MLWVEESSYRDDWLKYCKEITTVVFDETFADYRPTTTAFWFAGEHDQIPHGTGEYVKTAPALTHIVGIENLNTSEVTDMRDMFSCCCNLEELDVSHFDTSNVTNMIAMFKDCSRLRTLDVSNFHTASVDSFTRMFYGCSNLRTIYVGEGWSTDNAKWGDCSEYMFSGCTSLRGGRGTTYDPSRVDVFYAHIDGGSDNPGYFTEKTDMPTHIESVVKTDDSLHYAPDGTRVVGTRRGLNIMKMTDGNVRKIVVK